MTTFRKSIFDTYQVYLFTILTVLAIYFLTTGETKSLAFSWTFFLMFETFFYFLLGKQMNYLIIGEESLTIKNSWLWWRIKKYQFDNILDFEFNFVFRDGTALTITTKDYGRFGHLISTFNKEEIDDIRDKLREKGLRFTMKTEL